MEKQKKIKQNNALHDSMARKRAAALMMPLVPAKVVTASSSLTASSALPLRMAGGVGR